MQTKENLSQTVKDVKVEIIKEELLDAIEEGVRKFVRTTLEVYAKDEFLRYIGARLYEHTEKRKDYRNGSLHKTLLIPFGLIEDVNIPRGRKGGFVPKGGSKLSGKGGQFSTGINNCKNLSKMLHFYGWKL